MNSGNNKPNTEKTPHRMEVVIGSRISEYKISYNPTSKDADLQFLKSMAHSFQESAYRCQIENALPDGKSNMLGIPMVVNLAFSAELYLKYIITVKGEPSWGHDLKELYDNLKPEIQTKIIIAAGYKDSEFRELLEKNKDVFKKWRYLFEKGEPASSDVGFMDCFVCALEAFANRLKT